MLGFLELQASHAHGRFYNQLEEWLSGITELAPGAVTRRRRRPPALAAAREPPCTTCSARLARSNSSRAAVRAEAAGSAVKDLAKGVDQLVRQMRAEQKVVREWVDEQAPAGGGRGAQGLTEDRAANVARRSHSHGLRASRRTSYGEFWPGYVDVLSTLLLVVTFLMSVFMVAQFLVSQEACGKDKALGA